MSSADIPKPKIKAPLRPASKAGIKRSYPTMRTVLALMMREIGARYGRSPGGYLWALFSPMVLVIALSGGLAMLGRQPRYGETFMLYFASGHLMFAIYAQVQNAVGSSLKFNSSLLQFPTVTWIDTVLARFILNSLTGAVVFMMLVHVVALITGENMRFDLPELFMVVILAMLVALGFGTFTCYLFMEFQWLRQIWAFASRPLFILSGVLIMYEDLPRALQSILWWNPLMHVVSMSRQAIYARYDPDWVSPMYVLFFSLTLFIFGLFLLRQHHGRLLSDKF